MISRASTAVSRALRVVADVSCQTQVVTPLPSRGGIISPQGLWEFCIYEYGRYNRPLVLYIRDLIIISRPFSSLAMIGPRQSPCSLMIKNSTFALLVQPSWTRVTCLRYCCSYVWVPVQCTTNESADRSSTFAHDDISSCHIFRKYVYVFLSFAISLRPLIYLARCKTFNCRNTAYYWRPTGSSIFSFY